MIDPLIMWKVLKILSFLIIILVAGIAIYEYICLRQYLSIQANQEENDDN